jgi:hypothetical protein
MSSKVVMIIHQRGGDYNSVAHPRLWRCCAMRRVCASLLPGGNALYGPGPCPTLRSLVPYLPRPGSRFVCSSRAKGQDFVGALRRAPDLCCSSQMPLSTGRTADRGRSSLQGVGGTTAEPLQCMVNAPLTISRGGSMGYQGLGPWPFRRGEGGVRGAGGRESEPSPAPLKAVPVGTRTPGSGRQNAAPTGVRGLMPPPFFACTASVQKSGFGGTAPGTGRQNATPLRGFGGTLPPTNSSLSTRWTHEASRIFSAEVDKEKGMKFFRFCGILEGRAPGKENADDGS